MLRITVNEDDAGTRLTLEGRIAGPWVDELRRAGDAARGAGPLVLEMAGVSFVDAEGARLVRGLAEAGARVTNCSPFVREQLEGTCDEDDRK